MHRTKIKYRKKNAPQSKLQIRWLKNFKTIKRIEEN